MEYEKTVQGDGRRSGPEPVVALPSMSTRVPESIGVGEEAKVVEPLDAAARRTVAETVRTATEAVRASQPGLFTAAILGPDGRVAAHGRNRVFDACDPTAHAEIEAIRAACRARGSIALDGCVLCSNAEPCPMCLSAAYWAGVRLVYYACPKETVAAAVGFDDARLYGDLALPACQRTLVKTVRVDCAGAADAFYAWRDREASAPTVASTVSPSARVAASLPLDTTTRK
nr:Nucleoside deaminase [Pandoravirus belohorizontensis]